MTPRWHNIAQWARNCLREEGLIRDVALRARRAGKRLNSWITDLLGQAVALPEPSVQKSGNRSYQTRSAYLTLSE